MFRNRQLSTRVSVLQEELDRSDVKHAKHKQDKRSAVHPPELSAGDTVLGEELKSKIEENARLHRQVFESVERHQQSENELQERVRQLSEELSRQQQLLTETEQQYLQQLDTVDTERTQAQVQLEQQEKQLKDAQQKVKTLQTQMRSVTGAGSASPDNSISEQTTTFNETRDTRPDSVGVAGLQQWRRATPEMAPLMVAVTRCLVSLSTHSRQRWAHSPQGDCHPLPHLSTKKADNLEDFTETLQRCANDITQLLPQQVHSLDEECRVSTCTEALGVRNRQLQMSLKTFTSSLSRLQTHISCLRAQSSSHGNQATQSMDKLLVMLVQAGADFHKAATGKNLPGHNR
ncbi:hypothetical protein NP493_82g02029 [Ridgeia piscesae]|uniref:Protein phosphatase 1 regulatory subunit 21 six-helix bundle domain-containing protein n=1 Tax=Ridgeia piscesae TaxID=27915 RepID=A0AAD9P973_RIDPI|nr:hypothetical protein NP493_82g02029 [Ridgeia piscesae]